MTAMFKDLFSEGNIKNQPTIVNLLAYTGYFGRVIANSSIGHCDRFDPNTSVFSIQQTDKYREGALIYIARIRINVYSVSNLERCFVWLNVKANGSSCFL